MNLHLKLLYQESKLLIIKLFKLVRIKLFFKQYDTISLTGVRNLFKRYNFYFLESFKYGYMDI